MKISAARLTTESESSGFRPDVLEKVANLLGLLDALQRHPLLKKKIGSKRWDSPESVYFQIASIICRY